MELRDQNSDDTGKTDLHWHIVNYLNSHLAITGQVLLSHLLLVFVNKFLPSMLLIAPPCGRLLLLIKTRPLTQTVNLYRWIIISYVLFTGLKLSKPRALEDCLLVAAVLDRILCLIFTVIVIITSLALLL